MRLLETLVSVTALSLGLAVLAFLAVLVAAFDVLGVLISGVIVLLISYTVELEDGSAIYPELLAMRQLEQPKGPEEWGTQACQAGRGSTRHRRRARLLLRATVTTFRLTLDSHTS